MGLIVLRLLFVLTLALALALVGCLRIGAGDDLHLVCEEKSHSPRKAYDVGFLVAQTSVEGELDDMDRVAILEAARAHVITMGGRAHAGFVANLTEESGTWRFRAIGQNEGGPVDLYDVRVGYADDTASWSAMLPIRPPASVLAGAVAAANASEPARQVLGSALGAANASWDPGLPSCVTFEEGPGRVVVNVVQQRVVLIEAG